MLTPVLLFWCTDSRWWGANGWVCRRYVTCSFLYLNCIQACSDVLLDSSLITLTVPFSGNPHVQLAFSQIAARTLIQIL